MTPTEAVVRAAARHGLTLTDEAARDIADAALGAYDTVVTATNPVAAEVWAVIDEDGKEHMKRDLVRRILVEAVERGAVPVEPPRVKVLAAPDAGLVGDRMEVRATIRVRYAHTEAAPA